MLTHAPKWSLPAGNTVVPSRWQATAMSLDLHQPSVRQCPRGQSLRVRGRPVSLTVRKPAEHRVLSFV